MSISLKKKKDYNTWYKHINISDIWLKLVDKKVATFW